MGLNYRDNPVHIHIAASHSFSAAVRLTLSLLFSLFVRSRFAADRVCQQISLFVAHWALICWFVGEMISTYHALNCMKSECFWCPDYTRVDDFIWTSDGRLHTARYSAAASDTLSYLKKATSLHSFPKSNFSHQQDDKVRLNNSNISPRLLLPLRAGRYCSLCYQTSLSEKHGYKVIDLL